MVLSFILLAALPAVCGQLHDLAVEAGLLYFGTETDNISLDRKDYQDILRNTSLFGQIVAGNSQKFDQTEPTQDNFDFTNGDAITDIAGKTGQLLRCHNLVWHQQLPEFVTSGTFSADELTDIMKNHITKVMKHYKNQCYAWDVVNEALDDDGSFRSSPWFDTIGEDFIQIAFETAAQVASDADDDVKLYYNDFGIEFPGVKSDAAQKLISDLKDAGVQVDGVGFQAHFVVGETPDTDTQVANMGAFVDLGVEVAITELDIRMDLPANDDLLAQQSDDYASTVAACIQTDGCVGVTVWDFDDEFSWVPSTFEGQGAADLFDEDLKPKPAFDGTLAALQDGADAAKRKRAAF